VDDQVSSRILNQLASALERDDARLARRLRCGPHRPVRVARNVSAAIGVATVLMLATGIVTSVLGLVMMAVIVGIPVLLFTAGASILLVTSEFEARRVLGRIPR
jgi:Flp pilus assembly protein TadB